MAWDQVADLEEGTTADFDTVSPAWDAEVDAVGDFDAEVDADNDLNDHADAAHEGAVGLKYTFDDGNAMYGVANLDAVNQTSGVVAFWFDPNTFGLENAKVLNLFIAKDGAAATQWYLQLYNDGGTYQIRAIAVDDSAASQTTSFYNLADDWNQIVFMFKRSTGAGQNDGWMRLYIDDVLQEAKTGLDNDTKDWDLGWFGMCGTSSTTFSGDFYIDTIKLDPIGAPWASTLAVQGGSYGMAIPITESTTRYGLFTDPTDETEMMVDYFLDPNTIAMSVNDAFTVMAGIGDNVGGTTWSVYQNLVYESGAYHLKTYVVEDDGASTEVDDTILSDTYHEIRVYWKVASGVGQDDGRCHVYVNGVQTSSVTNVDNDLRDVDSMYYGAVAGLDAGTLGIFYMDTCRWNDEASSYQPSTASRALGAAAPGSLRVRLPSVAARALAAVSAGALRVRLPGAAARALARAAPGTYWISKAIRAMFKDYTLLGPKHIDVSSSKGQVAAPFRDYTLQAEKREYDA